MMHIIYIIDLRGKTLLFWEGVYNMWKTHTWGEDYEKFKCKIGSTTLGGDMVLRFWVG